MAVPPIEQTPIEVDPAMGHGGESGYGSGLSEYSTDSLTSSIRNYRYENGRRYHAYKAGSYPLPNDEREQERMDIVHHMYLLMLDGELHLAPVGPDIQRILDVGTGTGIWAIDAAETYRSAEVIGTDLSPIQPTWVPPNVSFQIDDAEEPWTFKSESFDLVHIRHLNGGIKDWGNLCKQTYNGLKPDGYVDITEYELLLYSDDDSIPKGSSLDRYYILVNEAANKSGGEFRLAANLDPFLKEAGFVGIHHEVRKLALGTWAADKKQKEIGAYMMLTVEDAFESYGMALLTRVLEMPVPEVEELIRVAKEQAKSRQIHGYVKVHLYYGRKPPMRGE